MYSTPTCLQRKRYLFVCINRRAEDNPKACCAAKDSEEVYRALKGEVAARGLAKLEARVCTSSCLDQCATGVTVLVEPDHFFTGASRSPTSRRLWMDSLRASRLNASWLPRINTKQDKSFLPMHHKPLTMQSAVAAVADCGLSLAPCLPARGEFRSCR
jgi:hypothetical protein